MLSTLILVTCLTAPGAEPAAELSLPTPHFHQQPGDPAWLVQAVQFHGHLGPNAVIGVRMGLAGLKAVGARGYFDIEVHCQGPFVKPPPSCLLDGLQVGTGATLGKRTLHWTPGEQIVVSVKNTKTGKTAEIRPTARLLELLGQLKSKSKMATAKDDDHAHDDASPVETLARKIAALPDAEILSVRATDAQP
jgi:formylmethanofuran dehydrogenase subunit E